jgi:hypothetical protein
MAQKKLIRFEEIKSFPNVLEHPQNMKGMWNDFFKNNHPVILELACGKGEYAVGLGRMHNNKNLINFYYLSELSRVGLENDKTCDLLFYGSINERRKIILEALEKSGLKIKTIFGIYAKARDQHFSECKAILNLHFYDSQIFQQIRTFYPLINNLPVISENFPLDSAANIYRDVIFTPNNQDFCEFVINTLANEEKFRKDSDNKLKLFRATEQFEEFDIALSKTISFFIENKLIHTQNNTN